MIPSLFAAQASFPMLPLIVAIPVLTAIVLLATPAKYTKYVALVGAVASGVLSINMLAGFDPAMGKMQFEESYELLPALGLSWSFGVDGISLFLVVLTGILFPITLVATKPSHDPKSYHFFIMLLMAGAMGAFLSLDLLLFFLFFEIVLVPMYFLIGGWGHGDRVYAAMKFFLYTMAASALMLVGIVSLAVLAQQDTDGITFDVVTLAENHNVSGTAATLIFLSFALAFMVKVPVFPVHTWLPNAHTEAPTAGSVILAGVMLKLGTYGFLRFGLYLFPNVMRDLAPIFLTLGVAGIVYGAAVATMQRDLKRLVAYSSVAHMGFIVLGIFAFNSQGLQGSVLQMVNHGISTGALFILVGWIYERRHTRQISQLGGLQKSAPVMAAIFTLVMLSSVGLPGLNGFPGEFLILLGGFSSTRWWTVVAVTGVILAALYLLWAYQRVFHGPAEGENAEMEDVKPTEFVAIAPLLVLIVFMGVYPKPVLDRIEPSVDALIAHVEDKADDNFKESEPALKERVGTDGLIDAAEEAHKKYKEEKESHGSGDSESSEGEHS